MGSAEGLELDEEEMEAQEEWLSEGVLTDDEYNQTVFNLFLFKTKYITTK